jgi:putative Holliday junction resolvase
VRILALDVGERRIGVAVSDPGGSLARPLRTLKRGSRQEDFAAIAELVTEQGAGLIVVGRPLSLDGTEGPQARRVARYAEALGAHLPVRVALWDERYTTMEAQEILRARSKGRRRRTRVAGEVDAIAAAVILQAYLDSNVRGVEDEKGG